MTDLLIAWASLAALLGGIVFCIAMIIAALIRRMQPWSGTDVANAEHYEADK